eukprot:340698-Amphidinium_carterae.1
MELLRHSSVTWKYDDLRWASATNACGEAQSTGYHHTRLSLSWLLVSMTGNSVSLGCAAV